MRNGNNVSPPPLDVLCPSATWPSVSRYLAGIDFVRLQQEDIQSGKGNLILRCSPAGFNSVAGHTQQIGKG